MKVITERNVPLLKRKEYTLKLQHEKKPTPKNEDVLKEVAKTVKAKEEVIAIKKIHDTYGSQEAVITAFAYVDEKAKKLIETINKKKKKGEKQEKKPTPEVKKEEPKKEAAKNDKETKTEK